MKQLGLTAAESFKPELQPPEKDWEVLGPVTGEVTSFRIKKMHY